LNILIKSLSDSIFYILGMYVYLPVASTSHEAICQIISPLSVILLLVVTGKLKIHKPVSSSQLHLHCKTQLCSATRQ